MSRDDEDSWLEDVSVWVHSLYPQVPWFNFIFMPILCAGVGIWIGAHYFGRWRIGFLSGIFAGLGMEALLIILTRIVIIILAIALVLLFLWYFALDAPKW